MAIALPSESISIASAPALALARRPPALALPMTGEPATEPLLLFGFLCVRSCCFMLSFLVKAFLHVGQRMFFSPVCFFPCRAAWPDVVNVSVQLWRTA